ncbi:MaoC family dehydratase N-terminal domain-containing protein [Novosphingobium sp. KCTC 2891]|uniref:FAS1-like dehydratase domain-containing protein n=1 Tax=Novosphingobium sp. KCTC 2891 TaxID=2989730 RepID=UPI002223508C|nr:MaoC family dehydratase N-terminal domain-containing protein [Novosphingobium sp. KCTC 2891]MCW1383530.1 MaoC family dehydratase N-terminal domain-containing protein [Novosphingobium sp. KCTC 2891]
MGAWDGWIGREDRKADRVSPGLLARWCATLDRAAPDGYAVPQGLHWCLCLPDAATALLGPDGHPARDESPASFLPPVPLPRRMWAASKVDFVSPIAADALIERVSRVVSVKEKQGASGPLVFVDVEHETLADDALAVREMQSLVYREAAPAGAAPVPPLPGHGAFDPAIWDVVRTLTPGEPLLFRYSALTFNSHRIHYDLPYAQDEEGYRGLVVHGPLMATLLLDLARRELGENALTQFAFRAVSPAICGEPLHLALRRAEEELVLGAYANDGRQIVAASARAE